MLILYNTPYIIHTKTRLHRMQRQTGKKIFYWQGILADPDVLSTYSEIFEKLISGNYKSANLDLKKLNHCRIYSARINDTDRLLFTTITINKKPFLLFLDVILNHDYEKSRFFKPQVLKKFLQLHSETLSNYVIIEEDFSSLTEELNFKPEAEAKATEELFFLPAEYYKQAYIELTDEQHIAKQTDLPLVLSGPPGSGKSCLALSLLTQIASQTSPSDLPILYITASKGLKEEMQEMWNQLPIAQTTGPEQVLFRTYDDLINEEAKDQSLVEEREFTQWFDLYCKKHKKRITSQKLTTNASLIYQELRILSGYSDKDYLKGVGEKQSLIYTHPDKQWIINIANDYALHLKKEKAIDPGLYKFSDNKARYSAIISDESQDFSHLQLETLSHFAKNNQICYCLDSHQSLHDEKSKRPFLKQLLKDYRHISLQTAHRCPDAVITLANKLINIKRNLTGGSSDKQEFAVIPHPHKNEGVVRWIIPNDTDLSQLQQQATSTQFVVITLPEYVSEARKLFGLHFKTGEAPNIFTTDQIKGLEYEKVVIYKMLDHEIFAEASKILDAEGYNEKTLENRRKNTQQGEERFGPWFNKLFTSFTRAKTSLIIYQTNPHKLERLTQLLTDSLPKENVKENTDSLAPSTVTDWEKEREKQLRQGNITQATMISQLLLQEKDIEIKAAPQNNNQIKINDTPPREEKNSLVEKEKLILKKRKQKYLKQLLEKEITLGDLIALFKNKHASSLLFDELLPNEPFLFFILFTQQSDVLKVVLKFSLEFSKVININHLRLRPRYPGRLKVYNLDPSTHLTENQIPPILIEMCLVPEYQEVLFHILENNQSIIENISIEDLLYTCKNTSLLYALIKSTPGREILNKILTVNPNIFKKLKAEDLTRLYSDTSVLWLLTLPEHLPLLSKLMNINSKFIDSLSVKDLMHAPAKEFFGEENRSMLCNLSSSNEGSGILRTWMINNPELAHVNIACLTAPIIKGSQVFSPPFTTLAYWSNGRLALEEMLFDDPPPRFAQELTLQDLFGSRGPGLSRNLMTFYSLCQDTAGLNILRKLFTYNEQLIKALKLDYLIYPTSNFNVKINTTKIEQANHYGCILSILDSREEGRDLLCYLFELNPALQHSFSLLSPEELKQRLRDPNYYSLSLSSTTQTTTSSSSTSSAFFVSKKISDLKVEDELKSTGKSFTSSSGQQT